MAKPASPIDISTAPRYNSSSPRNQTSNLTSALQEANATEFEHSSLNQVSAGATETRPQTSGRQDSTSNGYGSSYYGSGARPITMKERPRRESNTGSFMNGMSWGGVSVGSWIRDDILMSGTSPAMNQSPSFHSSSYLPKMEANFMKDFTCCGLVLDSLHDLLQHFEETHTQASAQTAQRTPHAGPPGRTGASPAIPISGSSSGNVDSVSAGQFGFRSNLGSQSNSNSFRFQRHGSDGFSKTHLSTVQDMDSLEDMEMDDAADLPPIEEQQGYEDSQTRQSNNQGQTPTTPQQFLKDTKRGPTLNINLANGLQQQGMRSPATAIPSAGHQSFGLQNNPTVSSVNTPSLGTQSMSQPNRTPDSSVPGTPGEADGEFGNGYTGGLSTPVAAQNMQGNDMNWTGGANNGFDGTIDQPAKRLMGKQGAGINQQQLQQAFKNYQGSGGANESELAKRLREQQLLTNMAHLGFQEEVKPFKCPVIGCEKAYKNQNGLKYHKTHGHQNQQLKQNEDGTFSIVDPLTSIPYPGTIGMEKEKPYRCEVCGKRYKNLNGLKYHRQHSPQCNPELKLSQIGLNLGSGGIGGNLQGLNVNANVAGAGLTGMGDSGIF